MTENEKNFLERIVELETKVVHLEYTNEQLETTLIEMQQKQKLMEDGLRLLHNQLQQVSDQKSATQSGQHIEPPPPHY